MMTNKCTNRSTGSTTIGNNNSNSCSKTTRSRTTRRRCSGTCSRKSTGSCFADNTTTTTTTKTVTTVATSSASASASASSYWSGTVIKETKNCDIGITFTGNGTDKSPLLIAEIELGGAFDRNTYLRAGLRVKSLNGIYVAKGWSAHRLDQAIRNANPGPITIVAQGIVVMPAASAVSAVSSSSHSSSSSLSSSSFNMLVQNSNTAILGTAAAGLNLYLNKSLNAIMVGRISPFSDFYTSGLQVRGGQQRITMISGEFCPSNPSDVFQMLMGQSQIHFVAVDAFIGTPEQIRKHNISNNINNNNNNNTEGGDRRIGIQPRKASMTIESRDNVVNDENESFDAIQTKLATQNGCALIKVQKSMKYERVCDGIRFQEYRGAIILPGMKDCILEEQGLASSSSIASKPRRISFVESISESSIFHKSLLKAGHVIVAVNGIPCPLHDLQATLEMIDNVEKDVHLDVFPTNNNNNNTTCTSATTCSNSTTKKNNTPTRSKKVTFSTTTTILAKGAPVSAPIQPPAGNAQTADLQSVPIFVARGA